VIIPSTTVTVLRTNEDAPPADDYDDAVESDTEVATALAACITPKSKRTFDPASGQVTVIEQFEIAFRPRAFEFTERDRVRDDRTGKVYQVESVTTSSAMLMQEAIRLTCSMVR
jgi:hypothetical protein